MATEFVPKFDRNRLPMIAMVVGPTLWIVGQLLRGTYVASELFLSTSAAEFQERTRLGGNGVRHEIAFDLIFILPGSVIAFIGFTSFFRRRANRSRVIKAATSFESLLIPIFAIANATMNAAMLLGAGRVNLDDPSHVVEPSNAIISTLGIGLLVTGLTWTLSVLLIVVLAVMLGFSWLRRRLTRGSQALPDEEKMERRRSAVPAR